MLGSVFSLEGDSFDRRSRLEKVLRRRLEFRRWTTQRDMIAHAGDEKLNTDIGARLAALRGLASAAPGPVTVIGRSSGARVASLFAAESAAVSLLICFSYPFRHPKRPDEPERYAHLARIATPTLILQGMSDGYGGVDILRKYELSPAVTVRFFDCAHDFGVSMEEWDGIADLLRDFCRRHSGVLAA